MNSFKTIVVFFILTASHCVCTADKTTKFKVCHHKAFTATSPMEIIPVRSMIECARACGGNQQCSGANYVVSKEDGNKCQLFGVETFTADCSKLSEHETSHFMFMENPCSYDQPYNGTKCLCDEGFTGDFCENPPRDCSNYVPVVEGIMRKIYLQESTTSLTVPCIGENLIIAKGMSAGSFATHKNAGWDSFKYGFGSLSDLEYWLGNDIIHRITSFGRSYKLKVSLQIEGPKTIDSSIYTNFEVDNERNLYTVRYGSSLRNPQVHDILTNGRPFQTMDRDPGGCANIWNASYWYDSGCPDPSFFAGTWIVNDTAVDMIYFAMYLHRD